MMLTVCAAVVKNAPVKYNRDTNGIFIYLFQEKEDSNQNKSETKPKARGTMLTLVSGIFFFGIENDNNSGSDAATCLFLP